jgi:topoisomerase-4 subunit A
MATRILPHNFRELLEAQIAILKHEEFVLYPDFIQKGLIDVSDYDNGNGKIKCRARIEETNEKTVTITEIPYGTTTTSLIDSIEKATKSGKIKILSISDFTAENVEIEIKLPRGIYAKDTIEGLYAFSDCEISLNANLTLIKNNLPESSNVDEVIRFNTKKLVDDLTRELEIDLGRLKDRLHARLLEQIFIEERLYKKIEEQTSLKAVNSTVEKSLQPFRKELIRDVTSEDIDKLLEIRIKRISRYDINRQAKEIKNIRKEIKTIEKHLQDVISYTISYLENINEKYGVLFPRNTEITEFKEVIARKVAISNLTLGYHRDSGFMGHAIKAEDETKDISFTCSEYDRILLIFSNGTYKVIPVTDKLFVGSELEYAGIMKRDTVFNIIYRDGRENQAYVKRFKSPKFIMEKEYSLYPEHKRSRILLLVFGEDKHARVSLVPSQRAKSNVVEVDFDSYLIKGPGAIGKRVSTRVVRRVVESTERILKERGNMPLPGIENTDSTPHTEDASKESPESEQGK